MADAADRLPDGAEVGDGAGNRQRLLVVSPPADRGVHKDGRSLNGLAAAFGRFAEAEHLMGEQVLALEDSVEQQGRQLTEMAAQLPDMKERINWLIANYYEEDVEAHAIRERLALQEVQLTNLTEAVRGLCETQIQWRQTLEKFLQVLGRVQSAPTAAPPASADHH